MSKKQKLISVAVFATLIILILSAIFLIKAPPSDSEEIGVVMRDAVLHERERINFFGILVNPGLVSAYTVTAILLLVAILIRIFAVPKFKVIPNSFQMLLEQLVDIFDGLAKDKSPDRNRFLSFYIFAAGCYIFAGTIFELFGFQAITERGLPISLPAPLADINGAIALALMSYGVILIGGLVANGFGGMFKALKDFSLPISMSFRLFGALLSGALVTELVYYYYSLSFVVPVIVGVLFTILHAVIQAYVLTMLTAQFYGESTEKKESKEK